MGDTTAYCEVEDVRAEGVTEARAEDDRVTELIALATLVITRVCGWRFGEYTETREFEGTGHATLWLDEPVSDITAAVITVGDTTEEVDPADIVVYPLYLRRDDGYDWDSGYKNVAVTGAWGFREDGAVPLAVKRACVLLVVDMAMNQRAKGAGRGRLLGERTDKYSYQLAQAGADLVGLPEADQLLIRYLRPNRMRSV